MRKDHFCVTAGSWGIGGGRKWVTAWITSSNYIVYKITTYSQAVASAVAHSASIVTTLDMFSLLGISIYPNGLRHEIKPAFKSSHDSRISLPVSSFKETMSKAHKVLHRCPVINERTCKQKENVP